MAEWVSQISGDVNSGAFEISLTKNEKYFGGPCLKVAISTRVQGDELQFLCSEQIKIVNEIADKLNYIDSMQEEWLSE